MIAVFAPARIASAAIATALLLTLGTAAHAAPEDVRVEFAPPPMEGTISLGIFDSDGKLVRVLHKEAEETEFKPGLNGLITFWNGRDDAGAEVAKGTYHARGFSVGDFVFEGEAYHLNDWITDEESLRIRRVIDFASNGEGFVILAELRDGSRIVAQLNSEEQLAQARPAPAGASHITAANGRIYILAGRTVSTFDPADGSTKPLAEGADAIAAAGDDLLIAAQSGIRQTKGTSGQLVKEWTLPAPVTALAGAAGHAAAISGGQMLLLRDGEWKPLSPPLKPRAVAIGDDVWAVDAESGAVAAFSHDGELLRSLAPEPDAPPARKVVAAGGGRIGLLEEDERSQRLRVLRRTGEGGETSTWETEVEKKIRFNGELRDVQTHIKSGKGLTFSPQRRITVPLRKNPLLPEGNPSLQVVVGTDKEGSFLQTYPGLPLRRISHTKGLVWAALAREPGSRVVTILQSDGVVVEEFTASRLANMMEFDAGAFEYPVPPRPTPEPEPAVEE